MKTYGANTLAFLDTFSGMVPIKVIAVETPGNGRQVTSGKLKVKVTATLGAYKKGEILESNAFRAVPRNHIIRHRYTSTINTQYSWE